MLATVWMRADRVDEAGDVARALTEDLERIDGVSRVISPTSLEVLQQDDQGLFFDELDADEAWPALRDTLLRHPFAGNFLVYAKSPDVVLSPDQGAHRTVDARTRSGSGWSPRCGASSTPIRRSRHRPSPAPRSSMPISTGCRGATSCC